MPKLLRLFPEDRFRKIGSKTRLPPEHSGSCPDNPAATRKAWDPRKGLIQSWEVGATLKIKRLLKDHITWFSNQVAFILAVVLAQVVEQLHSAQASWVRIPGHTGLFQFRITDNLFSLVIWVSLKNVPQTGTYSYFFFSVSYNLKKRRKSHNCVVPINQERKIKSIRGRPKLKKRQFHHLNIFPRE